MNTQALKNLSYGVYVISVLDKSNNRFSGCTVNSIMQLTSSPITIAISVNRNNYSNDLLKQRQKFAISVFGEHSNSSNIGNFGFKSGKDTDKFEEVSSIMIDGIKVLSDACAYFICDVIEQYEIGTHTLFIAEIKNCDTLLKDTPMTYGYYHNVIKGTTPPNATTYIKEETKNTALESYRCKICGYIYEGDIMKESDDFVCPICGVIKSNFEKQ